MKRLASDTHALPKLSEHDRERGAWEGGMLEMKNTLPQNPLTFPQPEGLMTKLLLVTLPTHDKTYIDFVDTGSRRIVFTPPTDSIVVCVGRISGGGGSEQERSSAVSWSFYKGG